MGFGALIAMEIFVIIGVPWISLLLISVIMLVINIVNYRKTAVLQQTEAGIILKIILWGIASAGLSFPIVLLLII